MEFIVDHYILYCMDGDGSADDDDKDLYNFNFCFTINSWRERSRMKNLIL